MSNKKNKKLVAKPLLQDKISIPQPKLETGGKLSISMKFAFLLGIISFMVYANTLKNGFVYDDPTVIKENTIVTKGISAIPEILATPYRRGYFIDDNELYRPLSLVTFAIEYQFFGLNPAPYHFFNILLFAGCVILLFLFLDKLFERKKTAVTFIASLLFALHPIHTEVVANIKSRDELLCFFFAFLCLNVFIKYIRAGKMSQLLLGSLCFFLSLLSKETVITFVAVIPLIFFFYRNENKKRGVYIIAGSAVIACIYLALRFSVLNAYHANNTADVPFINNALAQPGLSSESRIATAILILGYYIKLFVVPYPLVCDYSYSSIPFVHFGNIWVLVSLSIYIFIAVFGIRRFLKDHKDTFAFGILFFLITISLFTNIPFLIGTTMGERLMFFPSVGFCLVGALLIEKWGWKTAEPGIAILKRPIVLGIIIPVSVIYAVLTVDRNSDWIDNHTLYATDVKKEPGNSKLNYCLGSNLINAVAKQQTDPAKQKQVYYDAIKFLRRSIDVYPGYDNAQNGIGFAYFSVSLYDSAAVHYKQALLLNSKNLQATNNLAGVYYFTKKFPQAIELFKKAIQLNPDNANQYTNLGACYLGINQNDSAIYCMNKAILIDPGFSKSYENLAIIYKSLNKLDSAGKYEAIAKKYNPGFKL